MTVHHTAHPCKHFSPTARRAAAQQIVDAYARAGIPLGLGAILAGQYSAELLLSTGTLRGIATRIPSRDGAYWCWIMQVPGDQPRFPHSWELVLIAHLDTRERALEAARATEEASLYEHLLAGVDATPLATL